ncbi:hypothetical protein QQ045_000754 [Rhodiola kirilowii]
MFDLAQTIMSFLLGLVAFMCYVLLRARSKFPKKAPGSMGWPLVGETLAFLAPHDSTTAGSFIETRIGRYGKVFSSHLYGWPTIVSCDLELNMFVLQNEGKLFTVTYPKAMHNILGRLSVLIVTGEMHRKLRSVVIGFSNYSKSSPDFFNYVERLSNEILDKVGVIDHAKFFNEAKMFAFNITAKTLLNMTQEQVASTRIPQDFLPFMEGFVSLPLSLPGTAHYSAVKARERLTFKMHKIIEERRRKHKGANTDKESDFLDIMISRVDLSDEERVVNESLRCGNIVKYLFKKSLQDIEYKGYFIPAGWQVLPIFTATHVDSANHKNPFEFDPWRWTDHNAGKKVTPFGGGIRLCPGAALAQLETALFVHHLVLRFSWKVKGDDCPVAQPYVEFPKGLPLEFCPLNEMSLK